MKLLATLIFIITAIEPVACQKNTKINGNTAKRPGKDGVDTKLENIDTSGRTAIWRRQQVIRRSLNQAMDLNSQECVELGEYDCFEQVHLNLLGGNDPFDRARWQRPPTTSTLTPLAIERVVAWSCETRLKKDQATVFSKWRVNR